MIVFEVLLVLLVVPALLRPVLPVDRLPRWLDYLPVAALLLAVVHFFIEPYWFRLVPGYLLILVAFLTSLPRLLKPAPARQGSLFGKVLSVVGMIFGLLWLVLAVTLPMLLPMRTVAATGPYTVGTATYEWTDENRAEPYTDDPADQRELAVQFWYPTDAAQQRGGSSLTGAMLSTKEAAYPVLIFSHGATGMRSSSTSTYQELASHGYVVASIDHTHLNIFTRFADGRIVTTSPRFQEALNQSMAGDPAGDAAMAEMFRVRADDMIFVMDQIVQLNATGSPELPAGHMLVDQIGLFGHSAGGATAATVCREDARCGAALVIDGTMHGDILGFDAQDNPVLTEELFPKPMMLLNSGDLYDSEKYKDGYLPNLAAYEKTTQPAYNLVVERANHLNFTDLGIMLAKPVFGMMGSDQAMVGDIDPVLCIRALNGYSLAFFDQYIKGQPSPLLDGPSADYPFVRFEAKN